MMLMKAAGAPKALQQRQRGHGAWGQAHTSGVFVCVSVRGEKIRRKQKQEEALSIAAGEMEREHIKQNEPRVKTHTHAVRCLFLNPPRFTLPLQSKFRRIKTSRFLPNVILSMRNWFKSAIRGPESFYRQTPLIHLEVEQRWLDVTFSNKTFRKVCIQFTPVVFTGNTQPSRFSCFANSGRKKDRHGKREREMVILPLQLWPGPGCVTGL